MSNFSHFASILPVDDIQKSIQFYRAKLGFELTFSWNEPVDYAVLKRGGVSIHLSEKRDDFQASKTHTALYIFVEDVRKAFEEVQSKGVPIKTPLELRDYGMEDFDIVDPDGFILSFGRFKG